MPHGIICGSYGQYTTHYSNFRLLLLWFLSKLLMVDTFVGEIPLQSEANNFQSDKENMNIICK